MAENEHEHDDEPTETPVEGPETPQEPPEAPDAPNTPDEGEEVSEPPEDEQSTVPPPPKSERDMEQVFKRLDAEAIRHAKRVGDIMEEDAQDLLPCELCAKLLPGFRWPVVDEDQRARVLLAIGFEPEPDFRADTQSAVCPDCDGWGLVATGSKVQGQKALACTACKGKGWRGPREQATPQPAPGYVYDHTADGPPPEVPLDPDREAARKAAQDAGFMVIDTRTPAAT